MEVPCDEVCAHVAMCGDEADVGTEDMCLEGCNSESTEDQRQCVLDIPCEDVDGETFFSCLEEGGGGGAPDCAAVCGHFRECGVIDDDQIEQECVEVCGRDYEDDTRICLHTLECEEIAEGSVEMCGGP